MRVRVGSSGAQTRLQSASVITHVMSSMPARSAMIAQA
jgi:hypothetical protein